MPVPACTGSDQQQVRGCIPKLAGNGCRSAGDDQLILCRLIVGIITISSLHTTCAVAVNENEHFLKQDIVNYFGKIVPEEGEYQHNDLENRPATEEDREAIIRNNCGGQESVEAFMKMEPINAHAHLQSILCGNSTSLGIMNGKLVKGQWQSILFCEFDGPREMRHAAVSIVF